MFSGSYQVHIQTRTIFRDELLKQAVYFLQLLAHFGPIFFGVLSEHRHRTLVPSSLDLLYLDAVILQQAMKIRNLREDANRADDRKWRRPYRIRHASHHVSAARRDFVDADRQGDTFVPYPGHLRCRQAMLVNQAARILQTNQHLVIARRDHHQRVHFLAQPGYAAGFDVALEIQYEDPFAVPVGLAGSFLVSLLSGFGDRFQFLLGSDLVTQGVRYLLQTLVEALDDETTRFTALFGCRCGESDNKHDGYHDGNGLGQE